VAAQSAAVAAQSAAAAAQSAAAAAQSAAAAAPSPTADSSVVPFGGVDVPVAEVQRRLDAASALDGVDVPVGPEAEVGQVVA
jgi:hypothetical protein